MILVSGIKQLADDKFLFPAAHDAKTEAYELNSNLKKPPQKQNQI